MQQKLTHYKTNSTSTEGKKEFQGQETASYSCLNTHWLTKAMQEGPLPGQLSKVLALLGLYQYSRPSSLWPLALTLFPKPPLHRPGTQFLLVGRAGPGKPLPWQYLSHVRCLIRASPHVLVSGDMSPSAPSLPFPALALTNEHLRVYNSTPIGSTLTQIPQDEILWSKGMLQIFTALAEQNCHTAFLRGLSNYKHPRLPMTQ